MYESLKAKQELDVPESWRPKEAPLAVSSKRPRYRGGQLQSRPCSYTSSAELRSASNVRGQNMSLILRKLGSETLSFSPASSCGKIGFGRHRMTSLRILDLKVAFKVEEGLTTLSGHFFARKITCS